MTRWSHVEDRVLESELGGIGSVLVFLYFTPSLQAAAIFFFWVGGFVSFVSWGRL